MWRNTTLGDINMNEVAYENISGDKSLKLAFITQTLNEALQ